jgi:hypothetical protein
MREAGFLPYKHQSGKRLTQYFVPVLVFFFIVGAGRASKAASGLDQYGGTTSVRCPSGAKQHFYTQKIGNRWWICDPAGNGFFLKGVYNITFNVDNEQYALNQTKYASGLTAVWQLNWSLQQVNRLQSWGFNTSDGYDMLTPFETDNRWGTSNVIPVKMPADYISNLSRYVMSNTGNQCGPVGAGIKDMINGVGPAFTAYGYDYGDYFDPNFSVCIGNLIATGSPNIHSIATGINNDYLLMITIDEGDQTGGMFGPGPDFPTLPPVGLGGHAAWVTLATAPTQSGTNSSSRQNWLNGGTYSDHTVYSKQKLSTWLSNRYSGNITALNAAWGSSYTTFGGSGAGWRVGGGILDEDGTCPSRGSKSCWMGDDIALTGETAAMQADMNAFYSLYLDQYFSVMQSQWHNAKYGAPGLMLSMQLGGWGAPPRKEALIEAAKYLDLLEMGAVPAAPWECAYESGRVCSDNQQRIDFVAEYWGDHPWWNWEGIDANPDSAESAYSSSSPYTTQPQRGAGYQDMMTGMVHAKTRAGNYPVVGFMWWDMFDMDSEKRNWGLVTPLDNPYDGVSATIEGIDGNRGKDPLHYPTGGERKAYGDFIDAAKAANSSVYRILVH